MGVAYPGNIVNPIKLSFSLRGELEWMNSDLVSGHQQILKLNLRPSMCLEINEGLQIAHFDIFSFDQRRLLNLK